MNVLVIAPHPDDEVIGCGGTLAKLISRGHTAFVCIVTRPTADMYAAKVIERKKKEVRDMKKILGIKKVFFLNFPTQKLDTVPNANLHRAIYDCVNEVKPEIAFIPHKGDISKDHQIVFEAALFTLRPKPKSVTQKVLSYECLSSSEWGEKNRKMAFLPNVYEDISDFLDKKLEAMKVYKTEIQRFPHPRSTKGLRVSAEKRGMEVGVRAAEAFMLIREVNK
jgi:LmbE family N-acetylglucosaminyl deacetylase